jgi:hypothetical protein
MRKLEGKKIVLLLVELLVVFAFIVSIIVAVNLKKTFKEARNLVRGRHMEAIINAVYTYYIVYHKFPDCIPESGEAVEVTKCKEIELFLTSFPKDPSPGQKYFIEYLKEREGIRVFSSSPEAKKIEIIR